MKFIKELDIKIKILAALVGVFATLFGGLFFAEDRWNQTMDVALAKEETCTSINTVKQQTIQTFEKINKKIDVGNLAFQHRMVKLLQAQNETDLKEKPNDPQLLKIKKDLIEQENEIIEIWKKAAEIE